MHPGKVIRHFKHTYVADMDLGFMWGIGNP